MATKKTTKTSAKQTFQPIPNIRLSVSSSFNNTIITANALPSGKVISWTSSGQSGFKGTKKGTPYAATTAMKLLLEKLEPYKPETAEVTVSGAGNGRDAALRAIIGSGIKVLSVRDITPLPHNGTRAKKARRV
ncbi:30S ribosomal protein S11 [Candidatus Berkelbacteria bacterium RIFCSPLOWO2_01_FULL_50_28]|uniref:Small ribosomal subunit protein uS11 n=1 Tax=Candidatus Berkelbacteria bacterium RIFCSPLOWO2_01_FULL_50_28 TaxID=1797471 RepID=A0A1F5EBV2_9BACT|nr:MAG: 30S ribosomal protein S11 [Candidatus Berkelbacteria bacterium RIFCSPHIGHO2_01_FULL_50_36]OGD62249.1 MAG: 30S ribosomal protein S11 [Candidatus Berkelbacteria bacterium RIFCSPHIGHO2_12_FULL_50_11]OGD64892.1 MAG: 30S ribosomal protein S11 [Candidatus Berkelbacteria bacterium RIFCSPLOWO2_01_FULL_50_28]